MKSFRSVVLVAALCALLGACSPGGSGSDDGADPGAPSGGGGSTGGSTGGSGGGSDPAPTGVIDPTSGFLTTSAPIEHSNFNDGSTFIRLANGTMAYSANIDVAGSARRYVVIRPIASASNPPVLLLLHPSITSPEEMANLTDISDYVLTQGFWAVLPASGFGAWDQDPARPANRDVPFISALIDSLIADNGVNANRIYAAGFSDGGFMVERLACELSGKIASFGINAATLRSSLASICAPATLRSKIYFLGTADLVVPYNGILGGTANGLRSADDTMAFWVNQQSCGGIVASELPNIANDTTTVQLNRYTGCSNGTALQLYTINNGGHAWPGGQPSFTGLTTQDIAASGLIWRFVSGARR